MKTCPQCQKTLLRRPNEWEQFFLQRVFCSRACADIGRATTRVSNAEFKARYRQIKVKGRRILEHRYVMEVALGRPLLRSEQVHHINHDRLDNRLDNLELVTVREHAERHTWRPITKQCVVCSSDFTPHKTKRARQQTCGPQCKSKLLSIRNAERKAASI
jgi:Zn finger protein HypA/HybF involved in hydrogenase expression